MGSRIAKAICWLIGCHPVAMGYDDRGKGAWRVCTRCYRDLWPRAIRQDKGRGEWWAPHKEVGRPIHWAPQSDREVDSPRESGCRKENGSGRDRFPPAQNDVAEGSEMSRIDHKGLGKAARKKARAGELSPGFELRPVPTREKSGRVYRPREHRDPATETLKTRCRYMGKPITNANIREMGQPWWGGYAGRVIGDATLPEHERQDLRTAILHMRQVVTTCDAAIGAPSRHAVCLRLLAPVEAMHADASSPAPDDRDPDTRHRQAVSAWTQPDNWLYQGDKVSARMTTRVVLDDVLCADPAGLIEALRDVSHGLKGRKFPRV